MLVFYDNYMRVLCWFQNGPKWGG